MVGAENWPFGPDGKVTVPVSGNLRANNGDTLAAAAFAEQGLAYLPTFCVSLEIRAGTLVPITLDHPTIESAAVFAVYPPDRRPPAKLRAFIDFVLQRFSPEPPWDRG